MARFEWKPEYAVGVPAIDDHHRELFELVDGIEHADPDGRALPALIARLDRDMAKHFAEEEAHMSAIGYPDLERHAGEHRVFLEWLDTVRKTYRRSGEAPFELAVSVNRYLEKWFVNHILHSDMAYRDFATGPGKS